MADSPRIADLRRRVQKDPASIAFAQLAEELRRAGSFEESIEACRAGLAIHPGYLSARVTLGRALLEINALDEGQAELETVLKSAPENLAAIRGLAEVLHRRGQLPEALAQYRAALALAKNDPDLQQTVAELEKIVEPKKPAHVSEGLSFDQISSELFTIAPPPVEEPAIVAPAPEIQSTIDPTNPDATNPDATNPDVTNPESANPDATNPDATNPDAMNLESANPDVTNPDATNAVATNPESRIPNPEPEHPEPEHPEQQGPAERQIHALEQFLDAIHVARAQSRP